MTIGTTPLSKRQHWKGGAIGALLATGLGLGLLLLNLRLGEALSHLSYDVPFWSRPIVAPTEVVLVYLDDASHRDLQQDYGVPWDRGLYARLLDRLTAEHARAVTFDIIFSDLNQRQPQGDQKFAEAIKANGRVILGADYTAAAGEGWTVTRANPLFSEAAAGWGLVQLAADQDFEVRKHFHVPPGKFDDQYSSMSWGIARLAGIQFAQDPQERYRERWINHYGPPGTVPNISFVLALETNDFCPAGFFSNKVVAVGANLKTVGAGVRKDELRTPYTRGNTFCPGVDIHAAQVLNLLRQDWLTRTTAPVEIALIIVAGMLFGFGLSTVRPLSAVGLALGGTLLVTFVTHYLFWRHRLWFPWMVIVAAQIPVAVLWSVVFNSVQLYVQNRLFEQSLQMYLSPKLVKKFAHNKDLLKVGARKQLVTVLFSDIAGFTSISEGMDSDELAHEMNKYFEVAVNDCIHHTDGTIVKYIGDAIFAFWNAPEEQIDHALRGCEAALRFRDQPPQYVNSKQLITRIGLHMGLANVGNFGSTARVDYTAIGENINLASRMEGLNKYLGTEVLITSETQAGVAGRLVTRFLGQFQLKGFEKAVGVYELVGHLDRAEACRPLHEAFTEALKLFQQKDFLGAEGAFQRVLKIKPADGPAKFYLKFIAELHDHPLPTDWTGEVELKEK